MEKVQKKLDTDFISYHGCGLYKLDGSNVLIANGAQCSHPIKNCFWMNAEDAKNRVETRSKLLCNATRFKHYERWYFESLSKKHKSYSTDESSTDDSGYYPSSDEESTTSKLTIDIK